ncbi:MAG: helix-turn-helix domain-containing protein [Candidatus Burarchaeum sp.]|nr:helix-turn-helix domain-containing protein [Candidatus Burarchaeum sp.]MDO8340169.1 helix-turn-helix domain-containing protein [Candidatus Burarchaeum sp.]
MDKLSVKIAGEIALSDTPGGTMKKWREIFGITQVQLGEYLDITPSTISDYEGNRRKSPGIGIVKRFIEALIAIDAQRGEHVAQKFREEENSKKFFEVHDFSSAIGAEAFAKAIDAKVIANEEMLREKKIYGYTLIDSIKVILEMPYSEFPKLYGQTSERAFIFTKVSTGRSPMVVLRVTPMKPSIVVLHGIQAVDKLAIKIAQKERIPLLTTKFDLNEIGEALKKW